MRAVVHNALYAVLGDVFVPLLLKDASRMFVGRRYTEASNGYLVKSLILQNLISEGNGWIYEHEFHNNQRRNTKYKGLYEPRPVLGKLL